MTDIGVQVDPQALIRALLAARFAIAGRSRGHLRLNWPTDVLGNSGQSLTVPTDPTAPEFEQMMSAALAALEGAVICGEAASEALRSAVYPLIEVGGEEES